MYEVICTLFTYIHVCTCTYTHVDTCRHMQTHTKSYMHMFACIPACMHSFDSACMRASMRPWVHGHVYVSMNVCMYVRMHVGMWQY